MLALGDITERCLRFFGITKERVQTVFRTEDCGCAKRQAAMNQWGYRWQGLLFIPAYGFRKSWRSIVHGRTAIRLKVAGSYARMAVRALFEP